MKIFLDTANLDEIRRGLDMGMVDGVTTNPTLVSRENREFLPLVKDICALVPGPVSVEVTALDADGMIEEARRYAELAENVVIKVPINSEGLKVIRRLYEMGIRTNTTLIFSPSQALLAAKAGAAFVSPFVGRIDDISGSGMDLVEQIVQIFSNFDIQTEVIVASIRHPLHFVQSALIGADIATVPFSTLDRLLNHPLTEKGMASFLEDWKKVRK